MKQRYAALLPVLLLAACADEPTAPLAPSGAAELSRVTGFTFTTITVPNATETFASGINAGGDIVGSYSDANGTHGFLLRRGVFTPIDYPGAVLTEARGISPDGEIVGTYRMPGEFGWSYHGFLLTKAGEFVPLDYPGKANTMPQRILPDGTVLGCHHGERFAGMAGVIMGRSGYSETDATMSMHNGATPDLRRIAGLYTNMMERRTEGYVIDDGVFKPLLVPGSNRTRAWDVSPQGEVVGDYRIGSVNHGFLLRGEAYIPIDVPDAAHTWASGINARGDVVGFYLDGATRTFHGFIASRGGRPSL